ncbi:uncharacterized protein LOC124423560 [Vespa crabro]|uniref:uncharacterized protein LOC124423560 n=1 Tax=Vespa crabro TaxID=7445 RepID=UPI001F01716D|nr:uncharacterized protein LOC124423560 [Vespa crabro]XP_046817369.1 uncharacterized protein LOC124423560 [Vespa crabro]
MSRRNTDRKEKQEEANMMKYIIVACLCIMFVLGQAESQDQQETTTDKRVERSVDMTQIPQGSSILGQFADIPEQFANIPAQLVNIPNEFNKGMKNIMDGITDGLSNPKDLMNKSRRRRSSEQQ